MSSTPASCAGWLPTTPTGRPFSREKPTTMLRAKCSCTSKNSPLSTTRCTTSRMSYGLFGLSGTIVVELLVRAVGVVAGLHLRRQLEVVLRQERHEVAHVLEAALLVVGGEVRHARLRVVRHRPAELLELDLLARDRLDHVGAGDEHVRGLLDHEDEVGHGRGVDGAARARAHDHRDLRDHAGALHVADEHVAVGAQRDDALLDPRAARVVDADDRAADPGRQVHHLHHLLAHRLAERAAEDGEVLREDGHRAAVDRAVAGHDGVAPGAVVEHPEVAACGGGRTCRAPRTSPGRAACRSARGRSACRAACCFSSACGFVWMACSRSSWSWASFSS